MRDIEKIRSGFSVLENGVHLQTAAMVLDSGEESGSYGSEHPQSEQVLFVFEGTLEAEVGDKHFTMCSGDSTIVPLGAPHRFVNRSMERVVTFNVYSPKAY
jgi:mannose-6-phosphate isomerase-like protein (cupin superfamily)